MNVTELFNEICITLDKTVGYNEFVNCFNTIIRRLNSEAEKPVELITLTGTAATLIKDLDTAIIDMDEYFGAGGRWKDGVEWDSINYAVNLPRDYRKVLTVYYGDRRLEPISYDRLKEGANTYYYTTIGNTIYFNTDLDNAETEIKARVKRDYAKYVVGEEYEGLPENAYHLLTEGICYMLSSRPKYYNEVALALHKRQFEEAIINYNLDILMQDFKSIKEQPFHTLNP